MWKSQGRYREMLQKKYGGNNKDKGRRVEVGVGIRKEIKN